MPAAKVIWRIRFIPFDWGYFTITACIFGVNQRCLKDDVAKGTLIRTDGLPGYNELAALGYQHDALALGGDPAKAEAHLPMIHLVFSNLKTWILGTHHGRIEPKHLQAYLNEYMFRFNRRFYPMTAFNSVLGVACRVSAPSYAQLYSGEWAHPAAER